ncbi:MAG: hypothetical protein FJX54_23620 [Alphaproteobacteria bacterium]|nr:hypothetical protein [Alphaproteobacteria bacterium]
MTYLSVNFNEDEKNIEVKIAMPLVLSKVISRLRYEWSRRSGRPPFGKNDFLLSERARRDLALPELLSERDRVWMCHPGRF